MFDEIFENDFIDEIVENLGTEEKKKVQNIGIILDKSGSMSGMEKTIRNSVEEQIKNLHSLSKENDIHTFVTIALFSSFDDFTMKTFDLSKENVVEETNKFILEKYVCDGMTALYDSIFKVVKHIENQKDETKEIENLIITVSDGYENDSKEIKFNILKDIIENYEKMENPKWKFVYLGTMESLLSAKDININASNCMIFNDAKKLSKGFANINDVNTVYYGCRSTGTGNTKSITYSYENINIT